MTAVVVREAPSSLNVLAERINKEHEQVWRAGRVALEHAVTCGGLLLEAQAQVPKGTWLAWMRENVTVHPTTAYKYMRLGRQHKKVLEAGYEGVEEALQAIASDPWHHRTKLDEAAKLEMLKMAREHGISLENIAKEFNVSISTAHYWTSPMALKKRRVQQRTAQAKYRKAKQRMDVAKHGDQPATEAYSLIRKALQIIDGANGTELPRDVHRAYDEAIHALHKAEDEIAKALKLTPSTKVKNGTKNGSKAN